MRLIMTNEELTKKLSSMTDEEIEKFWEDRLAKNLKIYEWSNNSNGFYSIMKGVPMSEENLKTVRNHCIDVYGYTRRRLYVMYRGKRTSSSYCTLKKDAHSFDIYKRNVSYR